MQVFLTGMDVLRKVGRMAGPYLLLELLLPGGTLCALLLFLWQRRRPQSQMSARGLVKALMRTLGSVCGPGMLVPAPARVAVRLFKARSIERG